MTTNDEDAIETAQRRLEHAQRLLLAEISVYPTPISGCDARFNRLLSDRRRIAAALTALDQAPFIPAPRHPTEATAIESR